MPRIRTLKPEFWGDEKLGPCSALTRLVFLGLISMADDAGRVLDSVKQIDAFLFPYSDESSHGSLTELSRMGRIIRGETASGQKVIQIVNWHHQKINRPNTKAALPPVVKEVTDDSLNNHGNVSEASVPPASTFLHIPTTNDHHTNDQRPTTDTSSASPSGVWQPVLELRLAERLSTNAGRTALATVLATAASKPGKRAIADLIAMMLAGERGEPHATPEQMDRALCDYVVNGMSSGEFKANHFRATVANTIRGGDTTTPPLRLTRGQQALRAIEGL